MKDHNTDLFIIYIRPEEATVPRIEAEIDKIINKLHQKKMGNYLSSLEAAKKVYELQPNNINNLVNLSDLHRLNGNYIEAKVFSEKVIAIDSENKNAKKLLNVLNSMNN
jgi:tetratricopeptide (TPR) repeat protein